MKLPHKTTLAVALIAPTNAFAHPGDHGPNMLSHIASSPFHLLIIAAAVMSIVGMIKLVLNRKSKTK